MFYFNELTPTKVLTFGANAAILIISSLLSLAAITVMVVTLHDANKHRERVENLPILFVGTAHVVQSGPDTNCVVMTDPIQRQVYTNDAVGSTCDKIARNYVGNDQWKKYIIGPNGASFGSIMFAIVISLLLLVMSYPLMKIPAVILAAIIPPLRAILPLMILLTMLVPVGFLVAYFNAAMVQPPTGWAANGIVVRTYQACVTSDKMYHCADNFVGWADPQAGTEIGYHQYRFK